MNSFKTVATVILVSVIMLCQPEVADCTSAVDPNVGVLLTDDAGNLLYHQNKNKPFTPASILKILTSLSAIELLGPNFRFSTEYRFDNTSKNLYIKGKGDPLFISEEIERFCRQIIDTTLIQKVNHIILDHSYFSPNIRIPGRGKSLNPYDASIGALCANFNTITFKWDIRTRSFISGEPQTPLLPVFFDDIKNTHLKQGRITLSREQSRIYPGLLVEYFLEKNSIKVTGDIFEQTPRGLNTETQLFLSSFNITNVVQKLLRYSNNYIANQVLLTLGVMKYGEPATLEKGVKAINLYAEQILKIGPINIIEGSGLSRSTRISPDQMIKILIEFMPYYALLNNKGSDYFKTGTLSGVRTRAGFILGRNNKLYPYVIMINQKEKGYTSILKELKKKISQFSKETK